MAFSRRRMGRRRSRRSFHRTAKRIHYRNFLKPQRGGYRIG